jgi:hypothetical protein
MSSNVEPAFPSHLFDKEKKKCESEIKENINKIIKNDGKFCCMSKDISIVIPDKSEDAEPTDTLTKYLPTEEGNNWIRSLFLETLKTKELNPKALEQMKAKGITPKPQPLDILLIIIIPAEKSIKIGVSVPVTMELDLLRFCKKSLTSDIPILYTIEVYSDKLMFIEYPTEFELKEIDNALSLFFKQLKSEGIYIDDEPDEEYVNYLEGMEDSE